jgi:hypothetical protein
VILQVKNDFKLQYFYLVLLTVTLHRCGMRKDEMVCDNVRLRPGVASCSALRTPPRCMQAIVISQSSDNPRLVEGKPVLHPVPKHLEAEIGIVRKRPPLQQKKCIKDML